MSIEDVTFKKFKTNENRLISYGFIKENDTYKYSKTFMNESFRADICIDTTGKVQGKVIDLYLNEEYTNFRMENIVGEFVNTVKNEYIKILQDIANNCFEKQYFTFEQTNRITNAINQKYDVIPEFLWTTSPNHGIFRNVRNNKWFGIIMNIDKSKIISEETGEIEVLNLKLDDDVPKCLKIKGIYPAYHMNKKSWISIILDNTFLDKEILDLVDTSYKNSNV